MILKDLRFRLLMRLGALLYPGYRFKWPQMDWVSDARFNSYLTRFGAPARTDTVGSRSTRPSTKPLRV